MSTTALEADDSDGLVTVATPVERFPILGNLALAGLCLIAAVVIAGVTLPYILPEAVTRPTAERLISEIVGVPVKIEGEHHFRVLPAFHLRASKIKTRQPGDVVRELTIDRLDVDLDTLSLASGVLEIGEIAVSSPRVVFEFGRTTKGKATEKSEEGRRVDLAWGWWRNMSISDIKVTDGAMSLADVRTGHRLTWEGVSLGSRSAKSGQASGQGSGQGGGLEIAGKGLLNGKETAISVTGSDLRLLVSGSRWPMRATLTAPLLNVDFKGAFAARDQMTGVGTLSMASPDATALDAWLGPYLPVPLKGTLSFSGNVNMYGDVLSFRDINFVAGRTTASGEIDVLGVNSSSPTVDSRLKASLIELGNMEADGGGVIAGVRKLPIGRMNVSWSELAWGSSRMGRGELIIERAADRPSVHVELKESDLHGGSARGEITIDTSEGLHAVRGNARLLNVDIQSIFGTQVDPDAPLTGRLTVDGKFLSIGADMGELVKAMQGRFEVSAAAGVINLPEVVKVIGGGKSKKIDFEAANGTFVVAHGVARTDDVILKAPHVGIVGTASIDFSTGETDAELRVLEGEGGKRGMKKVDVHGKGDAWSAAPVN